MAAVPTVYFYQLVIFNGLTNASTQKVFTDIVFVLLTIDIIEFLKVVVELFTLKNRALKTI